LDITARASAPVVATTEDTPAPAGMYRITRPAKQYGNRR